MMRRNIIAGHAGGTKLRITEEQAEKNRCRVVAKASRLFREKGFDGVSVGQVMKAAGFTHGGFYNHFGSKEALELQALDHAFAQMEDLRAEMSSLEEFVSAYLSREARSAPGLTCPAAALSGDVSRQPAEVRRLFACGIERMIGSVARLLPEGGTSREDAIDIISRILGAMVLARAMPASSPLGDEFLSVARRRCLVPSSAPSDRRRGLRRR